MCGCGESHHHRPYHHEHGPGCGCGGGPGGWERGPSFRRRFATREERIARLEEYLSALRAEAQAVEEHLAELRAAG